MYINDLNNNLSNISGQIGDMSAKLNRVNSKLNGISNTLAKQDQKMNELLEEQAKAHKDLKKILQNQIDDRQKGLLKDFSSKYVFTLSSILKKIRKLNLPEAQIFNYYNYLEPLKEQGQGIKQYLMGGDLATLQDTLEDLEEFEDEMEKLEVYNEAKAISLKYLAEDNKIAEQTQQYLMKKQRLAFIEEELKQKASLGGAIGQLVFGVILVSISALIWFVPIVIAIFYLPVRNFMLNPFKKGIAGLQEQGKLQVRNKNYQQEQENLTAQLSTIESGLNHSLEQFRKLDTEMMQKIEQDRKETERIRKNYDEFWTLAA